MDIYVLPGPVRVNATMSQLQESELDELGTDRELDAVCKDWELDAVDRMEISV